MTDSTAPNFSHTATDLLLALIDLHDDHGDERAELIDDIEKSLAELTPTERDDLAPTIRCIAQLMIAHTH